MRDVRKLIEQCDYDYYGIRVDADIKYNVGDICNNSHNWWQDDPEDGSKYNADMQCWDGGELDGTCCLAVTPETFEKVLQKSNMYFGEHVTLIAGDYADCGNDIGELIIKDAKVIAIIK